MRLHRFYIDLDLSVGKEITVVEERYIHQWLSVFRFETGDLIMLFNGKGKQYQAVFSELHKKKAVILIQSEELAYVPEKKVHLYLSIIKKDLFEFAVEKVTELGVTSITPILCERTQGKNLNMERLEKIVIEASEQCGRGDVPVVREAVLLQDALAKAEGEVFICDTAEVGGGDNGTSNEVSIFIGPEGGWGPNDQKSFENISAKKISLGHTVLRAETAAIVSVAKFI